MSMTARLCRAGGTALLALAAALSALSCASDGRTSAPTAKAALSLIRPTADGAHFVQVETGARFIAWGFNYDHDASSRLIEEYWYDEWPKVVEDFGEMKALGANVVRIHLQVAKFMEAPDKPNAAALNQLARLVKLAEDTGLYLDLTGLGCYRRKDVPAWYSAMDETRRWEVQARFWDAVAGTCAASPAVFCYDLMNEPVVAGGSKKEADWLVGELGGFCFVQRITLDPAGRSAQQIAKAWVDNLAAAIRKRDDRHMITVGVIPWALVWPNAKPLFYSREVSANLDFASVHFYPKKGAVDKALAALAVYQIGKPLVVEEMYPLSCSLKELGAFIDGSRNMADGWIGFYWGKTIEEYAREKPRSMAAAISGSVTRRWLEYFRAKAPEIMSAPR